MIRTAGRRAESRIDRRPFRFDGAPLRPTLPGGWRGLDESTPSSGWWFFLTWLRHPLRTAAVLPSGEALAAAMTAGIDPTSAPVIELGPGTGVFTRALLARGVPEERIALVELGAEFVEPLRRQFPRATLVREDASRLGALQFFGGEPAGAVVSGLPLLAMPPNTVRRVLDEAFTRLRSDGAFFQFTYGFRCPVPPPLLDRLGLRATRVGIALRNVPPAAVYRIERR